MNKILPKILAIVIVIFVGLTGSYLYLKFSPSTGPIKDMLRKDLGLNVPGVQVTAGPTPIPVPRPIKLLPGGSQTYNFSHGSEVTGPKPIRATINPLTPKQDEKQSFEVLMTSDSDVTEALVIVVTDNKQTPYPLTLKDGNKQNGTWVGSWTLNDTYDYDYAIKFNLKNSSGTYAGALTFRMSIK